MTGFKDIFKSHSKNIFYLLLLLPIVWLLSGFYSVDQNEIAIPRILGKIGDYKGAGIHYIIPYPLGDVLTADIKKSQTLTVGFGTIDYDGMSSAELNGTIINYTGNSKETIFVDKNIFNQQFMTGDGNIIAVEMSVVFNISDPVEWFFNYEQPIELISAASQRVLFNTLSSSSIDNILVRDPLLEFNIKETIQKNLDSLKSGVYISSVTFNNVNLPVQNVETAFRDVKSAEDDRTKRIEEAHREASYIMTQAQTESRQLHDSAIIKGTELKNTALTENELFNKMLVSRNLENQYDYRIFSEIMETLLKTADKIIVDPQSVPDSIYLDKKGD